MREFPFVRFAFESIGQHCLHQTTACGHDAHVFHGDSTVFECSEGGFSSEVDGVFVGMLPELGHVDSEDVDVFFCHCRSPVVMV
jgi:hypothetical protein